MNPTRLMTISLVSLLTLGACGKNEDSTDVAGSTASNALLSYVPADTPYVFANLEPVPDDVIDVYIARLQPVLDSLQSQLSQARADMESTNTAAGDPAARFAHALLLEFDGKLNRSGLESMGFDLSSKQLIYGMGAFPVVRLGLSDSQALRDSIQRILDNAGIAAPERDYQGVAYWRLSDDSGQGVSPGFYMSILDDHLAFSLFPTTAEPELLPGLLGIAMPGDSDAQDRLQALNRAHGYTGYGSGILDTHKLADRFMSPDTVEGRLMLESGELDPGTLSQACVTEIHEILDNVPLMTMGTRQLDESAIAMQYRLETPETLAGQLMGLVSKIPAADVLSDQVLEFAFGMRFGPVRDFLREKATAIAENPYQCEHLLDLNGSAAQALARLEQPMPPFLNNFRGIRASLSQIVMSEDSIPENARGFVAVHVEQPQMFVGMAQMFLPDLSTLTIAPGEPPVQLPDSLVPAPGMIAFAAMSEDAIGLALGDGEQDSLPGFLDREPGPEGTFLSASYDMAAYLDYTESMRGLYDVAAEADNGNPHQQHTRAAEELRLSAVSAFREMADRSHTTMQFTPGGLVIDNRMTFK